ncbi:hypothetical protein HPB50_020747 [Hyalomma asiaticum]|uniref:Uncharacterized protein n=1 Tax=Hyalomma asiaticum TaxID=266040 RepID=A0ACB7RK73_HYAAI|nr:hypothetical protein HPB50_020747 [Hyalomma asiaticum]
MTLLLEQVRKQRKCAEKRLASLVRSKLQQHPIAMKKRDVVLRRFYSLRPAWTTYPCHVSGQ